ncbi:MAG TPA: UvrD-helicase domain-containing protein, partial [Ilumatobacteraceae bacterium]|nr:UvrD-helicase domain-containing protein [Ilumatobacteraceae bacterium]
MPEGVVVLEASAGTGKTSTIAALTARYVAAGTSLEQLLLVTFGRAATSELRDRVRARLVSAEAGLAGALAGVPPPPDDELLVLLATGTESEVRIRRDHLARALADFDRATIETTHGFCRRVLHGLGVAGDVDEDVAFVEDVADLVDDVVDDLYLRKFAHRDPEFSLAAARRIGREVVARPDAVIEPATEPDGSVAGLRQRLAVAVRAEVDRRKRRMRVLTYDDLLTRLLATVRDPERGPAACARLRERYAVVMVDEFQDTDPTQWEIVELAFADGATTLVLIGDPKQAIYAFRGADVHAYLEAAAHARTRATLDRNWRSDEDLLTAYDALFAGTALGDPRIEYRAVRAVDGHRDRRLRHAPHPAALRMRVVHRADGRVKLTATKELAAKPSAVQEVSRDVAADIVELLSSRAELPGGEPADSRARPVHPGDVAVLVSTHREAAAVREALAAAGVPAVIGGDGSVFATRSAREWCSLLEAVERPSHTARVHVAAMTCFLGWSAQRVATATDAAWEDVYVRLHEWGDVVRRRGIAALLEVITHGEGLTARMLSRDGGERELTDVRHIGQLLHHAAATDRLGVTALLAWLRRRISDAGAELHDEERSRRLDSDAEATQILTIHRSKGLEFPIVYCPFLWSPWYIPRDALPVFHAAGGHRCIDVGGEEWAGHADHMARHVAEIRGETLRLAYVALTRARHQAVVHWASAWESECSPLATLLLGPDLAEAPPERAVVARMEEVAARAGGTICVERVGPGTGARWAPAAGPPPDLAIRAFDRAVDTAWRRTSYSALTSEAKDAAVASEAEHRGTVDEDVEVGVEVGGADGGPGAPGGPAAAVPLAAMAGGARVGTLVHGVLEDTDFTAADVTAALHDALRAQPTWNPAGIAPADVIVDGLALAIETPLGPLAGGRRLRDISRRDRLDELTFELPLAGGDTPSADVGVGALADLLERHLPPDDPLAGYAAHLRDPRLDQRLRGYLTGSIDAVLRFAGDGPARFAVVDYKTNWLAPEGAELTSWHYRPAALATAMQHAHYPLQALLYVVALHRFLRWRIGDYDPDEHLAGVLYLFLRGMVGPTTLRDGDTPYGVFSWRPP